MSTIFLCGDVMTGRGIDQVLPHPSDARLYEAYVVDARDYVTLAEQRHGPIPRPVGYDYVWGDALDEFTRAAPDLRIINLETSVTRSDTYWPGKGIHYRMHPDNIPCLLAADIDCCVLANNHTLDWGQAGLLETLRSLDQAGIAHAGAGHDAATAARPSAFHTSGGETIVVYAYGTQSSGIYPTWAAAQHRPGINYLPTLDGDSAQRLIAQLRGSSSRPPITICSMHWGGNWGYDVPEDHIALAHRMIDQAHVDIVYGHSSHHVKGIEVYNGKLILYGCGDLITDYEGIGGHASFRSDLTCMYFATLDPVDHQLTDLEMVPMRMKKFRLTHADRSETDWLQAVLSREGARFGTTAAKSEKSLVLQWKLMA